MSQLHVEKGIQPLVSLVRSPGVYISVKKQYIGDNSCYGDCQFFLFPWFKMKNDKTDDGGVKSELLHKQTNNKRRG